MPAGIIVKAVAKQVIKALAKSGTKVKKAPKKKPNQVTGKNEAEAVKRAQRVKSADSGATLTSRISKGPGTRGVSNQTLAKDTKRRLKETLKGRAKDQAAAKAKKANTKKAAGTGASVGSVTGSDYSSRRKAQSTDNSQ